MDKLGLYVIATQPPISYGDLARICVRSGIRMLQLREKELSDSDLLAAALEIREATRGTLTKFVVNDRADIALLAQADILHLGQDDLTPTQARKIVGDMPIGLSTHSLEQVRAAMAENPIYIGFGPVFPTTTKAKPDPTVGLDLLSQAIAISRVPVVAIGGIFPENLDQVLAAGATSFSMVRYLMQDPDRIQKWGK